MRAGSERSDRGGRGHQVDDTAPDGHRHHRAQRESQRGHHDEPRASRAASASFHELVIEISGNSLLAELWRTLSGRMRWLLGQHDQPAEMHEEHVRIYAAIAAHDEEAAAALALAHLETSRRAFASHRLLTEGTIPLNRG